MRKIDKIIIHCSATVEGLDYSVDTIRGWHIKRGFSDIGYHFVIAQDGGIFIGRPIEKEGAHAKGYNANSIGICYVGGVDAQNSPKDTRTPEQRRSLKALVMGLRQLFPDATVHGHNEFANKACPSFNVQEEAFAWT